MVETAVNYELIRRMQSCQRTRRACLSNINSAVIVQIWSRDNTWISLLHSLSDYELSALYTKYAVVYSIKSRIQLSRFYSYPYTAYIYQLQTKNVYAICGLLPLLVLLLHLVRPISYRCACQRRTEWLSSIIIYPRGAWCAYCSRSPSITTN